MCAFQRATTAQMRAAHAVLKQSRWRGVEQLVGKDAIDAAVFGGQLRRAIDLCEDELLQSPRNAELASLVHLLYVELGMPSQAWWSVERRGPMGAALSANLGMRAFALQMDNWHQRAEESAARCLAQDPGDCWALLALLEVYGKEGRHRESLRLLRDLDEHVEASEMHAVFALRRCHALLELGKTPALETALDTATQRIDGGPWAHWAVADAARLFWRMRMYNVEGYQAAARALLEHQVVGAPTAFDAVSRALLAMACGLQVSAPERPACGGDVAAIFDSAGLTVVAALGCVANDPVPLIQARGLFAKLGGTCLHRDVLDETLAFAAMRVPNLNLAMAHELLARRPSSPRAWLLHSKVLAWLGYHASADKAEIRARDLGFEQGGNFS